MTAVQMTTVGMKGLRLVLTLYYNPHKSDQIDRKWSATYPSLHVKLYIHIHMTMSEIKTNVYFHEYQT